MDFDIIIIGSGAAGAHAADELSQYDYNIAVLDVGNIDEKYSKLIPSQSFQEIRKTDPQQARYFLGDELEGVPKDTTKPGAQLTPPRKFITKGIEDFYSDSLKNFFPVQSLAKGGLGEGWGGGVFEFNKAELRAAGLPEVEMSKWYQKAAVEVGVSGDKGGNVCKEFSPTIPMQSPLPIDANCRKIFEVYQRNKNYFNNKFHFQMGRLPLAVLSSDHELYKNRKKNSLTNMDFYVDHNKSFYKPSYTIDRLIDAQKISYFSGYFVEKLVLDQQKAEKEVLGFRADDKSSFKFSSRVVLLCAGALNSGRLVLKSTRHSNAVLPLMCNPYFYIPTLNWSNFGGKNDEYKFSGGQLSGHFYSDWEQSPVVTVLFSYESLLNFRLVQQMPLPPSLGLLLSRTLMTSLTIGLAHLPDQIHPKNKMSLDHESLRIEYGHLDVTKIDGSVKKLKQILSKLRLTPLGAPLSPGQGASIHYAGTLINSEKHGFLAQTNGKGQLLEDSRVFVADASTWTFLPAKGLTFTIMANARRVASQAHQQLQEMGLGKR